MINFHKKSKHRTKISTYINTKYSTENDFLFLDSVIPPSAIESVVIRSSAGQFSEELLRCAFLEICNAIGSWIDIYLYI